MTTVKTRIARAAIAVAALATLLYTAGAPHIRGG